jgi:hypothetical protein
LQIHSYNFGCKRQDFNHKWHMCLTNPHSCFGQVAKKSNKKRHHLASMWHLVVIVITYFLWLKVDFSFITLDEHHSNVAFVNYRSTKLLWFCNHLCNYNMPNQIMSLIFAWMMLMLPCGSGRRVGGSSILDPSLIQVTLKPRPRLKD